METTHTNRRGESRREGGHMAATAVSTTAVSAVDFEAECREFVREFPTLNARRAVVLAECGRLSWEDVHGVFHGALSRALADVAA